MDTSTKKATLDSLEIFDYWSYIPVDDISPLKLSQKIETSIGQLIELLGTISHSDYSSFNQYLSFEWSLSVRDFAILLRDSILASVKEEQLKKDNILVKESYADEIQTIIQKAANDLVKEYTSGETAEHNVKVWQHQESPIEEVVDQLKELQKQSKKIYRSSAKIDDIRHNISDYTKDFHLQYSKQSNAVKQLLNIVEEVKILINGITSESSETMINNVVDEISDKSQKLEMVQGTDSIEILPYQNNETFNLPISTARGILNYKSINIKSEFARWFSSFIYPQMVELESMRDHAIEKCLFALSQIRTKIAAISLADLDDTLGLQKDFDQIFSQLNKEVLESLREEEEEANALVALHEKEYLVASNVYSNEMLFLPENGSSQISNMSRDAQKRILSYFSRYRKDVKNYFKKVLSRYVEVDKTPYSQYIKNQLSIYDKDDTLALFMKNGYLGKSFTVPRPELIDHIVGDYQLWLDGFAGAILLSGMTGSGKSTLLGMINQLGLNEEIIQLKTGESYFIRHQSFDPKYNLKDLIDLVMKQTRGRRVVVCIDDLELWHNEENELYDNITQLFEIITKYRNKAFFVVTCSPFLRKRIGLFKNLDSTFSSQLTLGKMNPAQIRNALNLRARVRDLKNEKELDQEARVGNIIREAKGNIGFAMLEYCRYYNEAYKPNLKSYGFKEMIDTHHTLLSYISAYHHTSLSDLLSLLSEIDKKGTKKSVDHLVGQKILIRPKKGYVAINPLLVHTIEQSLSKF